MLTVLTVALGIPYLGFALSNVGTNWPVLAIGLTYNTVMVAGVLVLCFSRRAVPAKLKAARVELKTAGAAGRERLKEGIRTLEELAEGEGTIQLTHSH